MTLVTPRRTLAALGSACILLTLSGCGSGVTSAGENSADTGGATVTIENCGRELIVDGVPDAVVGLSPAQTELLIRLGLTDRLVGQAQTAMTELPDDIAAEAAGIPVLSEDAPPAREDLLAAAPDFVFSPTTYEFTAEQGFAGIEQLEQAGAAGYVATGGCFDRRMEGTVEDLFVDLDNLGRIFGVPAQADALIEESRQTLATVAAATEGRDKPNVAQVFIEGDTLSAIGAGIEYDIVAKAGGDNVFGPDDETFADFFAAQITPEALASADPDALIFAVRDDSAATAARDYLRRTFPDLTAVREDRLIAIDSADTFPGTLGNVDVVREIAEQLYPEAFGR